MSTHNEGLLSTHKEGMSLPGEADDKCCWCMPIKIGVILIGVSMILCAVSTIYHAGYFINYGHGGWENLMGPNYCFGILMGFAGVLIVLGAAWFYIKFFMADSAATRAGLAKACMIVILAQSCLFGIQVFMLIYRYQTFEVAISYLVPMAISNIIFIYYAGVAKRFASQA